MSHEGADIGEFLESLTGVHVPQQITQDEDVVESFLPSALVQGIDDIEDTFTPTKKQKTSKRGRGRPTKMAKTYTMRRRNYRPKLSYRLKKLEQCHGIETHYKDTNVAVSALPTNSLQTFALLSNIPQGNDIVNRIGKKTTLKGFSISVQLPAAVTQNVDFFLIRPANSNSNPVATDFNFAAGAGKMLQHDKGWQIRHWMSRQPCYNNTINCFVPMRNMKITYDGSNPVDNNVYFCISNDTGANIDVTGTVRAWFVG